jgi:hypothetical protein
MKTPSQIYSAVILLCCAVLAKVMYYIYTPFAALRAPRNFDCSLTISEGVL